MTIGSYDPSGGGDGRCPVVIAIERSMRRFTGEHIKTAVDDYPSLRHALERIELDLRRRGSASMAAAADLVHDILRNTAR